jgi:hypothetical protein
VPNIADFAKLCHVTNIVQPLGKSDIKICQIGNAAEEEDFFFSMELVRRRSSRGLLQPAASENFERGVTRANAPNSLLAAVGRFLPN